MQYREFQALWIIAQGGDFRIHYYFPGHFLNSLVTTCFEGTMSLSQISMLCVPPPSLHQETSKESGQHQALGLGVAWCPAAERQGDLM